MVVPLPPMDGPLPAGCEKDWERTKWSICAIISTGILRLLVVLCNGTLALEFSNLLQTFMVVVMGIFSFKDEEPLKNAYLCLKTSICQACATLWPGGRPCLLPFMLCTVINCFFCVVSIIGFFSLLPLKEICSSTALTFDLLSNLGLTLAQAAASIFSWKVVRAGLPQGTDDTGYSRMEAGNQRLPWAANQNLPSSSRPQPALPSQGAGFVPFGGKGNVLGS